MSRFEADFSTSQPRNVIKSYDANPNDPNTRMLVAVTIERPSGLLQLTDEVWDYMLAQAEINQSVQSAED